MEVCDNCNKPLEDDYEYKASIYIKNSIEKRFKAEEFCNDCSKLMYNVITAEKIVKILKDSAI